VKQIKTTFINHCRNQRWRKAILATLWEKEENAMMFKRYEVGTK
jgi:hypothetical protein